MAAKLLSDRGLDVNLRSGPQMREYEAIVARIAADRPPRILDWGCGWGQVTHMLKGAGLDVAAMDYDAARSEPAVERLERFPDVEAILTPEPVKLPFGDGEFDAVLSLGVLEHVCHPRESLREIRRVLRPGGTLYVYKLPNRFSYLERLAKRLGIYYHGQLPCDAIYTKRTAVELVRGEGFQVLEARRANMLPLTLAHPLVQRATRAVWAVNVGLSRVPGVNALATNVELVARRTA